MGARRVVDESEEGAAEPSAKVRLVFGLLGCMRGRLQSTLTRRE